MSSKTRPFPQKMQIMIDFISNVEPFEETKSFLLSILKIAMSLVDEAEFGVILYDNAKILVSHGYEVPINELALLKNDLLSISGCEIISLEDIEKDKWSRRLKEIFGIRLASSLICSLTVNGKERALMRLDISDKSKGGFSDNDLRVMKIYRKLLSNVLKIKDMNDSLKARENIYESIVEKSHDAIFIFKDGIFLFVNEKATEITGYSSEELLHKVSAWDIVHPIDRETLKSFARERKAGRFAPQQYQARLITKQGKTKLCDFNVKKISLGEEKNVLLGSARDITDEEKAKKDLELANMEIKGAYRELEKLNVRFQNMTRLLAKMGISNVSEEEFLKQVLHSALQVVPVAQYGSVSIFHGNKWEFVAAVGHDIEKLKKLTLKREYAIIKREKPIVENIFEYDRKVVPQSVFSKLVGSVLPVKQTIIAPLDLAGEVEGFLALDIPKSSGRFFSNEDVKAVESFAKIASAFYILRKYLIAQEEMKEKITLVLVKALEKYDPYTKGHSQRVAECSCNLAIALGLEKKEVKEIRQEAILHDVGKLFVPLSILNKKEKLTWEEFEEIKKHPIIGSDLVKEGAELSDMALVIKHHHEWWNGKGYPDGLQGEEIPLHSRIMAICDAYDAMTSDRAYRKAKSKEQALKEISENAGEQFDPKMVKIFLKIMSEVKEKI